MPAPDTYARFYIHPTLIGDPDPREPKAKQYKDVVMSEIFIKGDTKTSFGRRVYTDEEKKVLWTNHRGENLPELYPKAWAAFNNQEYSDNGTPINQLPKIGPSEAINLQTMGVETIEDLAALPDNVVIGRQGMLELRKRAIAYLLALEPDKEDDRDREMQELKQQLAQMQGVIAQASIPTKRTRRKRNAEGLLE